MPIAVFESGAARMEDHRKPIEAAITEWALIF
jgi:hypothetical protein